VLVAQQWQEVFNVWALDQQESPTPAIAFYSDILQSMWPKLLMNDQTWERAIDNRYFDMGCTGTTSSGWVNTPPPPPPPSPAPSPAPTPLAPPVKWQMPHHNLHPNPDLQAFKDKTSGQSIKLIIKNAKDVRNPVPCNNNGEEMCVTFHCIAAYNNNCKCRCDHNTLMKGQCSNCRAHNPGKDAHLLAWCKLAFPGTKGSH
jgi:hypothetical protein